MRLRHSSAAILLALLLASTAFAWGEETLGNKPLVESNYPATLVPIVNHSSRVYHTWVNGHELFYYRGDTESLNAFLRAFASTEATAHQVVLVPALGHAKTFKGQDIPFAWQIEFMGGVSQTLFREDLADLLWSASPVITLHVDAIKLDELQAPDGVELVTLGKLKEQAIKAIAESKSKTVRGWGCGRLAALDAYDPRSLEAITARLADPDSWVRLNAIGALQPFGAAAAPAIPELRKLAAGDADEQTKKTIADTIEHVESAEPQAEMIAQHAEQLRKIDDYARHRQTPVP